MRPSVYVYVLLALPSSLTLAAPLSASERRFVIPPPGFPHLPIPPPVIPPPLLPPPDIAPPDIAPPDIVPPGEPALKRADGALRPVVGQAGHPFFPLPPDLDSPVALPTPILDRDDQGSFPDVLGDFFKAHPNLVFDRGVNEDYRRNYMDALHDLLHGAGTLS